MKKILLTSIFFLGMLLPLFAQPGGDKPANDPGQKIQALYIAFISRELKLTEAEAQKFWPVHTEFDNEVKAVKPEMNELDRQQAVLNIKKKYQDRFVKIIGPDRTNNFYKVDAEFRKKLVERLQKLRQQRMNGGKLKNKKLNSGADWE
ncbi:MAG TPA: hypothetical protein PKC62_09205 [Ferruginibacter sp.]|jgi:hypothetical protein|nr:hypothetical protein [Bacteroidota bacterium]MCC6693369.1 hypothetical protein [Chitinophagaceae bacterium]HMT96851.1 hypothetical protein [Ferruginibacter sp.]MBS1924517.1 hypothetical protein [Bacteroidota bacterium]HMU25386.1 hypothetical protein [Ferruginibacter sp.]